MSYISIKNAYGQNDPTTYKAINHLIFLENREKEKAEGYGNRNTRRNGTYGRKSKGTSSRWYFRFGLLDIIRKWGKTWV